MSGQKGNFQAQLEREQRRSQELQEQLEQSRAELSEFAVLASHDLRAPLRAISNLTDWVEEDLAAGQLDEVRTHLATLRRRAHRMDLLLQGLLEFSRVGRKDGSAVELDVVAMIDGIVEELKLPATFKVTRPDVSIVVAGPELALRRVLYSLIANGHTHHDRADGHVDIVIHEDGEWLSFQISDDGPGIPAKHHEKAFKPLCTLKRRDELEASGMGLAVVKKATEFYGNGVVLESDGRGCRFTFEWPKRWPR